MTRKSNKFLILILSSILFCGVLLLCTTSCHTNTSRDKHSLNIAISHDPMSLDPRNVSLSKDISIAQALYEGLVRERPNHPELALTERYTVSDDKTIYTFYLKDTSWSNGDPVTAHDFEESIKQILHLGAACSSNSLLGVIKNYQAVMSKQLPIESLGIRAIDTLQLEITLEKPIPHFLELLAAPIFFPVHKSLREFSSSGGEKLPYISNGPFIIDSYHPQTQLIIKKNPLYHDKHSVHIETITFQIVPDAHTSLQLFQKHLVDWVGSPWSSPISKEEQHHISKDKLHTYPVLGTTSLICNLKNSPTNNIFLRKALAYAIDKPSLLQFVSHGKVANHFLPPELSKMPRISAQSPEKRQQQAYAYFKEAEKELSQKQISELSIIYPIESTCLNAIVQEIQQQIKNVLGIHLTIQGLEYHCFLDKRRREDFTLATGRWIAEYPRPSSFLTFLGNLKNNESTKWENAQYNRILTELLSQEEKIQDQILAEELIDAENPIIPLYHFNYTYAANPKIHNAYTSLLGHIDLKEIELTA
ncbi:peptide ABC transporter substrate-binding protein [Chlamydia felis]|nr:peptide ABC transporter substrate-binding protein [Chlamydia felis]